MINRTLSPPTGPIPRMSFPDVKERTLANGTQIYFIQKGTQPVLDIRLTTPGGKIFEETAGAAGITARMLMEGTRSLTGYEFSKKLDEFGAFCQVESGYEYGTIHLTVLEKHLEKVLPLVQSLMEEPGLPSEEFVNMKKRILENLKIEEKKTDYVARREFGKLLFGVDHPYGRVAGAKEVDALKLPDIIQNYEKNWKNSPWKIFVSGKFDEEGVSRSLEKFFGDNSKPVRESTFMDPSRFTQLSSQSGRHQFEVADAVQSTIRMGIPGCNRSHPDYYGMQILNTLFGGFFGSRLMKNIREDKGYTYGIGSGWISFKHTGMWIIQTSVANEYVEKTITEVYKELDLLLDKGVSPKELEVVKNYTFGKTISGLETASQVAESVVHLVVNELPYTELDKKYETLINITPKEILELARRNIQKEAFLEVVAGGK